MASPVDSDITTDDLSGLIHEETCDLMDVLATLQFCCQQQGQGRSDDFQSAVTGMGVILGWSADRLGKINVAGQDLARLAAKAQGGAR